jgi:hypothetical protein
MGEVDEEKQKLLSLGMNVRLGPCPVRVDSHLCVSSIVYKIPDIYRHTFQVSFDSGVPPSIWAEIRAFHTLPIQNKFNAPLEAIELI